MLRNILKSSATYNIDNLGTPERIQDFLNTLEFNFELEGETLMSPRRVLESGRAHCMEGALLAAALLSETGQKPLLMDLKASRKDFDHVVALFRNKGYWGAISKTNHGVLRYREPVYETPRELALSYFHEYFLPDGTKTLKSFSKPFDLSRLGTSWVNTEEDLFDISHKLDHSPHQKIVPHKIKFRKADQIEIRMGDITEFRSST